MGLSKRLDKHNDAAPLHAGFAWKRAVDTAQKAPSDAAVNEAEYSDFSGNYYELHGKAGLVLVAVKLPQTGAGLTAGSSQGLRTATAA